MGRHSVNSYTFTEWVVTISAITSAIALPILLITIVVAQIVILNR